MKWKRLVMYERCFSRLNRQAVGSITKCDIVAPSTAPKRKSATRAYPHVAFTNSISLKSFTRQNAKPITSRKTRKNAMLLYGSELVLLPGLVAEITVMKMMYCKP